MSKFVKHEPCPRCGSRDNLARYSDGSAFCFGCRYFVPSTTSGFVRERENRTENGDNENENLVYKLRQLGISRDYPERMVQWLNSAGVSVEQAIKAGICYSHANDSAVFIYRGKDGKPVCIQERNFNPKQASKAKYTNTGSQLDVLVCCKQGMVGRPSCGLEDGSEDSTSKILCVTEDFLSALRISLVKPLNGLQFDGFPALGTQVAKEKIMALKPYYSQVLVWLDRDKFREGQAIADAFKWQGLSARAIYTELDPKKYTDKEILDYLCN